MYLSPEQKAIVKYNEGEGPLIVEAGPGSGKTRVLTERVRYLLTNKSGNFRVLCLTFTNKAAEEMRERLENVPQVKERAFIDTIHAFCLDIIRSRHHELGYNEMPHILDREEDRKKLLEQVLLENEPYREAYITRKERDTGKLLNRISRKIGEIKRNLVIVDEETEELDKLSEHDIFIIREYNNLLSIQNFIDYDDILLLAYRILTESPGAGRLYQRLYRYILVDEAQDLNYAQYQIIKALCGRDKKNVFMVGDPNQAIYGFSGSNRRYMQEFFKKDFGAETKYITQNYRSAQAIIKLANSLGNIKKNNSINAHFRGELAINNFSNEQAEAAWIIEKIKMLLGTEDKEIEGVIDPSKMVVLARNKFVFRELENQLAGDTTLCEKFYHKKGTYLLEPESELIKLYDLGTRLLANPFTRIHTRQLLNIIQVKVENVYETAGYDRLAYIAENIPENNDYQKLYRKLLPAWKLIAGDEGKITRALNTIKESINGEELGEEERAHILLDLRDWQDCWSKYIRSSTSENRSLANFRRFIAMGNQRKQDIENKLALATVHTVKGLEFDIVFLMGMTDGTFPDYRSLNNPEKLKEELNNAYVAVTRAKRKIFITYPKLKLMPWGDYKSQRISRFLHSVQNKIG